MQAFLPGRCKNFAESYDVAPTPPSFSKQTEYYVTHADTYTQYLPRKKGGVCSSFGLLRSGYLMAAIA